MPLDCVGMPTSAGAGAVDLPSRYLDIDHIGQGATCFVLKAHDTFLDRKVAIKCMRPELTDYASVRRFQQEAKMMSGFSLMHLPVVLDFGLSPGGRPYMVMELVEGASIKELIEEQGPFSVGLAIEVTIQVLAALDHAHDRGIVHRDLKAQNIMLCTGEDGKPLVKVVDFGLAGGINKTGHITEVGAALGTPFYMSPEQAQGKTTDARSDIYSLGCVLFEMLTGCTPFERPSMAETLDAHIRLIAPSLGSRAHVENDLLCELEVVVAKMLEKDPDRRFRTAEELQVVLEDLAWQMQNDEAERLKRLMNKVAVAGRLCSTSSTNLKAIGPQQSHQNIAEFPSWQGRAQAAEAPARRTPVRAQSGSSSPQPKRLNGAAMILSALAIAAFVLCVLEAGFALMLQSQSAVDRLGVLAPEQLSRRDSPLPLSTGQVCGFFTKRYDGTRDSKFHVCEDYLWALPDLTDADLVSIKRFPNVRNVNLVTAQSVKGEGLHAIQDLPIENLDLRCLTISPIGFDSIIRMPELRILRLDNMPFLTASKLQKLRQAPKLEVLSVGGTHLSRQCQLAIAALPHLKEVVLDGASGLDDSTMELLAGVNTLKWVSVKHEQTISSSAILNFKRARPDVSLKY